MTKHLNDDQIAQAVAGLELDREAHAHVDGCVSCRRAVATFEETVARRRAEMLDAAPDWDAHRRAVMARVTTPVPTRAGWRSGTRRALLALAAAMVVAVGVTALWPDRPSEPRPASGDVPVARILEETEALLADDAIPGFEPIQWDAEDLGLGAEVPTPSTTS